MDKDRVLCTLHLCVKCHKTLVISNIHWYALQSLGTLLNFLQISSLESIFQNDRHVHIAIMYTASTEIYCGQPIIA